MKTTNRNTHIAVTGVACMLSLLLWASCKKDNGTPVTPVIPVTPPDTTLRISALSATTLHYGDTLTISGSNFSATASGNSVTVNGMTVNVQSATATQLKIVIPALGATGGEVKVKTGSQTASGGNITYMPDIFVVGSQNNGAHALAICWKNGIPDTLSREESALTAVFIHDNDIYAAGMERMNNLQLANYWKNGNKVTLGVGQSQANAIVVNGNEVHVGGWEVVNGFDIPRYWKNSVGISVNVNDPIISQIVLGNGKCAGIYVKDNNTYAVGTYRNSQGRFEPWEFTNAITPANTMSNNDKHCNANAIFVSGNDKYVVGCQNNATTGLPMVTCWKNNIAATLTEGMVSVGVATGVFVSGNDVYIAGYEQEDYYHGGPTVAKYWKNGTAVKLSTASSVATGIAVFGNDVYVSGWENNGTYDVAKYWKNGTPVNLGDAIHYSAGNAIVVR